ncbi:DUF1559 family PulG-like putative transporter [Frigoriglobus tundricola]|uniref:DUF1559 domain-containing protein n=1 Tax=Frigoriglobus tundricola TaxID=2774151 RepID=A0A6M5YI98_9BACT|nr:DUF1559 domain-containing protein [Frigoriglobus tundricola]QJW92692.1 hypothetical protein FTUN_0189 [Frigoriglobus tundricola]
MVESWSRLIPGGVVAVLFVAWGIAGRAGPDTPAPADPLPVGLRFVPPDAAVFVYADCSALWASASGQAILAAEKPAITELNDNVLKLTGLKTDELKSVVWFVPSLKTPEDIQRFGIIFTASNSIDARTLTAGLQSLLPEGTKVRLLSPEKGVAVALVGLGDEYAKRRPADADGPLAPALKAAGTGKYALVAGTTFTELSEKLLNRLPPEWGGFEALFQARSAWATVALGRSLDLDVRVRTRRAAEAADAEKALGVLVTRLGDGIARVQPAWKKKGEADAEFKALVRVCEVAAESAKNAKVSADGSEAWLTATMPLAGLAPNRAARALRTSITEDGSVRRSANNLKQIGLAMHVYNEVNKSFPPAAVCDKKGKPQLSWRVLILPYIEHEELYKEFKLDEPWDSAHNKKLLAKMPSVYALPGSEPGATETHYRVFVGNGAGFDWITGPKVGDIVDGLANTLMVVTAAKAVPWTKPDELEFDPEQDMTKLVGSVVAGRPQFLRFDGSAHTFEKVPPRVQMHRFITRSEGVPVGPFDGE